MHNWRQESPVADLKARRNRINYAHLFWRQLPVVNVEITLNSVWIDRLRNQGPSLLKSPSDQDVLDQLAFGFGQIQQGLVLVQRGISRAETRVRGAVNPFGRVVRNQLRRWVIGVQLDLIDCRGNLSPS